MNLINIEIYLLLDVLSQGCIFFCSSQKLFWQQKLRKTPKSPKNLAKEQEKKKSKRSQTYYKKLISDSSLWKMEEYTSLLRATYIPASDGEQYL